MAAAAHEYSRDTLPSHDIRARSTHTIPNDTIRKPPNLKPPITHIHLQEEVQLDIKSFDMGVLFLPSKIPPKRSFPMDYDSDDSDDVAAVAAAAENGGPVPAPFSCHPEGVLFQKKRLSYRCPEVAPAPRLKTLPLGLLPIPQQLPGKPTCS